LNAGGISDFQLYIMREKEAYLKSLNDHSNATNISFYKQIVDHDIHAPLPHQKLYNAGSSFNNNLGGSLLESAAPAGRKKNDTLLNSNLGKQSSSSQNSLHFMSKNLSNTPVEEADRHQGK
jgi:hypothetical protein